MKVTYKQLLESVGALQALASQQLSGTLTVQIARLVKAVNAELATFNEVKDGFIKQYGEKQPDDSFIVPEAARFECGKLIDQAASEAIYIRVKPLHWDGMSQVNLKPLDLIALEWALTGLDLSPDEVSEVTEINV